MFSPFLLYCAFNKTGSKFLEPSSGQRIVIDTARDRASFLMHLVAGAAVFGGTILAVGSPLLGAAAFGLTLLWRYAIHYYWNKSNHVQKILPRAERKLTPDHFLEALIRQNPRLGQALQGMRMDGYAIVRPPRDQIRVNGLLDAVDAISARLGLHKPPPLHILDHDIADPDTARGTDATEARNARGKLRALFNKRVNAGAISIGKNFILLSEPLFRMLPDEAIRAVIGHEAAHIVARHHQKAGELSLLTNAASMTAGLWLMGTLFGSLTNIGVFLMTAMTMQLMRDLTGKPAKQAAQADQKAVPPPLSRRMQALSIPIFAGFAFFFGTPPLLGAAGIAFVTARAARLVDMSLSRRHEYQADRIGAAAVQDPQGLIEALSLAHRHNLALEWAEKAQAPPAAAAQEKGGVLTRVFARAAALYRTHPPFEARRAALEATVKKPLAGAGLAP